MLILSKYADTAELGRNDYPRIVAAQVVGADGCVQVILEGGSCYLWNRFVSRLR